MYFALVIMRNKMSDKKVWIVTLEKNVYINVEVSKDDAQTEDEAIDKAFEDLSYDDKKNYEFVSITEEE